MRTLHENQGIIVNRREFLGHAVWAGAFCVTRASFAKVTKRPNIVLLLTDDNDAVDISDEMIVSAKNKLRNKDIEFIGWVKEEDMPLYYNKLKLFVLPTKQIEGLPTVCCIKSRRWASFHSSFLGS